MARVTVEDCLEKVENRFALVLLAAERAHQLEMGTSEPLVPADNDKPTVLALREIAAGFDVLKAVQNEQAQMNQEAIKPKIPSLSDAEVKDLMDDVAE